MEQQRAIGRVAAGGGRPDVIVVGAGVIGLSSALALADRGVRVCIVGETRAGEASPAAAGILGPSLEDTHGARVPSAVERFALAARDRYVSFLADLFDRSGVAVPLNRLGMLEIATDDAGADALRQRRHGEWLDPPRLAALQPGLDRAVGGLYFEHDGAVDNLALLRALAAAVDCSSRIVQFEATVTSVAIDATQVRCTTGASGEAYEAARVVLAAGAWVAQIAGLPRRIPVEPLRGQMFSIGAEGGARLRHVVYGPGVYLVPRGDRVLVGATLERVGFDPTTTPSALAELRRAGAAVWPAIGTTPIASSWAGLRPATPDLLPIIGADPDWRSVVYACGHSRNGILMAPLTADCVAATLTDSAVSADISPFRIDRFDAR